jgi:site-specific DNA-cytosine methylase
VSPEYLEAIEKVKLLSKCLNIPELTIDNKLRHPIRKQFNQLSLEGVEEKVFEKIPDLAIEYAQKEAEAKATECKKAVEKKVEEKAKLYEKATADRAKQAKAKENAELAAKKIENDAIARQQAANKLDESIAAEGRAAEERPDKEFYATYNGGRRKRTLRKHKRTLRKHKRTHRRTHRR